MLVLTRKVGERIRIGNDIEIVVRRVAGNRVALAIEAPREVPILRGELEQHVNSGEEPYLIIQDRIPRSAIPDAGCFV